MGLSRRSFLAAVAGAPAAAVLARPGAARGRLSAAALPRIANSDVALLDPEHSCILSESLRGFVECLRASGIEFKKVQADAIGFCKLLVVPGAIFQSSQLAEVLRDCAAIGATVLYESGAAYAAPEAFAAEQRLLNHYFHVAIGPHLELWPGSKAVNPSPRELYVRYTWPDETYIRDFSRIVLVTAHRGSTIAALGATPVACMTEVHCGRFIFLGSPIGPHLLAGDRGAATWLQSLLAA
jgi:hypothetical protein